jgi:hypothetical protein
VASRLYPRSGTRTAEHRPQRVPAVLALRSGLPRTSSRATFLGVSDSLGTVRLQSLESAAVLGDRWACRDQSPAVLQYRNCTSRWIADGGADHRPRHRLSSRSHLGRQSARVGARRASAASIASSSPPPRATRCSSCCTATSIACGRSGRSRTGRFNPCGGCILRQCRGSHRPQPARFDVAVERHHRRDASADGAGRRPGGVVVRDRARHAAAGPAGAGTIRGP